MSRVIHFDITADDPERAATFYEEAFGWKIEKWDGPMEYWLVESGPPEEPGINGGISQRTEDNNVTDFTIGVASLEAAIAAVEKNGGTVLRPMSAVPGVGWMAYCADTEGNTFGIMQDDTEAA